MSAAIADVPGFVGIAGIGPTVLDYINAVYKKFPYTLGLIALVTFVLLVRTFRSILLPSRRCCSTSSRSPRPSARPCCSGRRGTGSEQIFGIDATGAVTFWLPVLIFAFLFGLSMDYEVFILARMREEYDKTSDTDEAVVTGLARTGRLVTGAAMILFLSFVALTRRPAPTSRCSPLPWASASCSTPRSCGRCWCRLWCQLFGRWNWWLPTWAARAVRVEPHAAIPEPRRPSRELVGADD